jgi:hypothetical protein
MAMQEQKLEPHTHVIWLVPKSTKWPLAARPSMPPTMSLPACSERRLQCIHRIVMSRGSPSFRSSLAMPNIAKKGCPACILHHTAACTFKRAGSHPTAVLSSWVILKKCRSSPADPQQILLGRTAVMGNCRHQVASLPGLMLLPRSMHCLLGSLAQAGVVFQHQLAKLVTQLNLLDGLGCQRLQRRHKAGLEQLRGPEHSPRVIMA